MPWRGRFRDRFGRNPFTDKTASVIRRKHRQVTNRWVLGSGRLKVVQGMIHRNYHIFFVLPILTCLLVAPTQAKQSVDIVVKTILASQGPEYLDPRLSSLVEELRSVFKYSSYRLLSEDGSSLGMGETREVSLPGKRILKVTPVQVTGDRIELQLVILKKKKNIFQTVVKLLNKSSLTVGGPEYEDGYLLFNISASF